MNLHPPRKPGLPQRGDREREREAARDRHARELRETRTASLAEGEVLGRLETAVEVMRALLGTELAPEDLDRIELAWRRDGLPADCLRRVMDVQANPGTWRERLGIPESGDPAGGSGPGARRRRCPPRTGRRSSLPNPCPGRPRPAPGALVCFQPLAGAYNRLQFRVTREPTGAMWMCRPTLKDQVAANLQAGLGMRKIPPEEGAAHLNSYGDLTDPDGRPWTPGSLAAFMKEHDIHPERVPDLSHFRPVNNDRSWINPRNILRTIERGFDEEQDELKRRIGDDPEVRRAVIEICSVVNDNPYDPGLYDRWLAHARQCE